MSNPGAPSPDPEIGEFVSRHVGPGVDEIAAMLRTLGVSSLEALLDETIPDSIRDQSLDLGP